MKKITFSLFVFALMALTGCDNMTKTSQTGFGQYDLAVLDKGQINFYSAKTGNLTPYTGETDSVVSATYAKNDLYYTVSLCDSVVLKRLKLSDANSKPEKLAFLNLTLDECVGVAGFPIDNMFASADETVIAIESDMVYMFNAYSNVTLYDISTGTVKKEKSFSFDPETGESEYFEYDFNAKEVSDFGSMFSDDEQGSLWYNNSEKDERICISDKINYAETFGVSQEEIAEEVFFSEPLRMSPDRQHVLFRTVLPWGDYGLGSYCVATLDGKQQNNLHSDIFNKTPDWLSDGSLVYIHDLENVNIDDQTAELMIMKSDGTTERISSSTNYVVKPY